MPRRIALFFDGTWNTPHDDSDCGTGNTNVRQLYNAVLPVGADGVPQVKWYNEGVGTKWYNRLRGGAFGVGLSEHIREGYAKLVELYEPGDEVLVFGFSRGAYTARSLVGLIRNAGLLKREHRKQVRAAYELYRARDGGADSESALFFRAHYSREIRIRCLGVWDTVGALGIPLPSFEWFNRGYYQFHDTELSSIVENAFHAVAIDEHRKPYEAALWDPRFKPHQHMEQVWFAGAHANVGGGYPDSRASDLALRWMSERVATRCVLALDPSQLPATPADDHSLAPLVDSFKKFIKGLFSVTNERHYRVIGAREFGNEAFHESVLQRARLGAYRPPNTLGRYLPNAPWRTTDPDALAAGPAERRAPQALVVEAGR